MLPNIPVSHIAAFAQDGNGQERGLDRLAAYRNTEVVAMCTRTAAILLTCPLLGNNLPITDQVHATSIRFGIRLCQSSLSVNLTLSNGTVLTAVDFAQNDNTVTFGQLLLAIKIAVCTDIDDLTVITTSVSIVEWKDTKTAAKPQQLRIRFCETEC